MPKHCSRIIGTLICLAGLGASISPLHAQTPALPKFTINHAARTGTTWPFYIAREAGYYQKYGLDVNLVFGVHPAGIAMIVSGEAAMTTTRWNRPCRQGREMAPWCSWPVRSRRACSP